MARSANLSILTMGLYALMFLTSLPAHAQRRHRVTVQDLQSIKYFDWGMDVSPRDGTLAYVVDDNLWLVETTRGTPHEIGQGTFPRWSVDGRKLAFYSKRSGTLQLWVWDRQSDQTAQITDFEKGINPDPLARFTGWVGDPLRYSWSPDGTKIVFTSRARTNGSETLAAVPSDAIGASGGSDSRMGPEERPLVLTTTTSPEWTLAGLFPGSAPTGMSAESNENKPTLSGNRLFIADVSSKLVEQITEDNKGYFTPDWSPDGTKIVCVSTEGRPMTGYGPDTSNVYVVDVATNRKTALTTGFGQKRIPFWSPDGKWIAYLGGAQNSVQSLFVLPSTGGEPINVTIRLDRSIFYTLYWSSDGHSVFVSYQDGVALPIARVFIPSGEVQRVIEGDVVCLPFTISRAGTLVWVQSDGSSTGVLHAADSNGHNPRVVLDLNPQIKGWILGKQEIVRWKNRRGDKIDGILIKPADYEEGKTYPLIVDPYPGVLNSIVGEPMLGNQAFASLGYAVFFPNERTPHSWENPVKDKMYNEAARGPEGADVMMDDLMTGIETVAKMGLVEPERMCLYGFSNGGGAVNLIVTRTTRFKCAVSASGVGTDWAFSFFISGDSTFANLIGGMTPWDHPDAYIKLSPVYHLDKVKTPMLLAVGDEEEIGVVMLVEMYNGLRYLGRDVTMLRYPRQGHGFTGTAFEDYWKRVNDFFDAHLKPTAARLVP